MTIANLDQAPILDSTANESKNNAPQSTTTSGMDNQKIVSPKWRQWYDQLVKTINALVNAVNTIVAELTSPNDNQQFLSGSNPLTWSLPRLHYGEMFYHNDVSFYTQSMTINLPAQLTPFDTNDKGQLNTAAFTYLASTLTCKIAGTYRGEWSLSYGSSTSNNKHHFWLATNGVEEIQTENHSKPDNSSDVISTTGNGFLQLIANDAVTLVCNCQNANETLTMYACNVNLFRLGD